MFFYHFYEKNCELYNELTRIGLPIKKSPSCIGFNQSERGIKKY